MKLSGTIHLPVKTNSLSSSASVYKAQLTVDGLTVTTSSFTYDSSVSYVAIVSGSLGSTAPARRFDYTVIYNPDNYLFNGKQDLLTNKIGDVTTQDTLISLTKTMSSGNQYKFIFTFESKNQFVQIGWPTGQNTYKATFIGQLGTDKLQGTIVKCTFKNGSTLDLITATYTNKILTLNVNSEANSMYNHIYLEKIILIS